jgi:RNA polymerase sigma-70 factor (ECF subfamily)
MRRIAPAELPVSLPQPEQELAEAQEIEDDRLRLLFTCCHPALAPEAQTALALRTLGGLTTREIARAYLEPEATTAQRLTRTKNKIRAARIPYEVPPREKLPERIAAVLEVLYLIFNEGYASTDAPSLLRVDLVAEAIRLSRLTVELLPEEPEARGLLALMLLTDARRPARVSAGGDLVPLEEQDRRLWNAAAIEEGRLLVEAALRERRPGPYQLQAAIAAVHAEAPVAAETDWPQIAALYTELLRWMPTPVVELNAAVALGMAREPEMALAWIDRLDTAGKLSRYHLLPASRADLLRRMRRWEEAAAEYRRAVDLATNGAERRFLEARFEECASQVFPSRAMTRPS